MRNNPLKAFANIKKQELPLTLLMFSYFFLVISTFWIFKPLKKTLLVNHYSNGGLELFGATFSGAQAELFAKVLNMVVAFLAVVAFTSLSRRLRRQQLSYVFTAFCLVVTLVFLTQAGQPSELGVWSFYLFGDLFNTLMLATFFAFLNDSFPAEAAKRLYGPIVLGGVIGGAFGSLSVFAMVRSGALTLEDWLLIAAAVMVVIGVVAGLAGREVRRHPPPEDADADAEATAQPEGNAAIAGARLVGRSRYLLALVVMVGIYEIVSTILDFQFTATIEALVPADERGDAFSAVYAVTNTFAMVFQLFATGYLLQRIGVRGALKIMPIAVAAVSVGYLIAPVVVLGAALSTSDNGLNYSVNQSAREALYTVTSKREKYQAKAFIDMFIQRFAKALAVGVSLLITLIFSDFEDIRWLSLITIAGAAVWFFAARAAGDEFRVRAARQADRKDGA